MIVVKIFYAFLFLSFGILILKYRKIVKSWTGNFYWAERYLGTGGTYIVINLIGMGLIFYGILYPLGGLSYIFSK